MGTHYCAYWQYSLVLNTFRGGKQCNVNAFLSSIIIHVHVYTVHVYMIHMHHPVRSSLGKALSPHVLSLLDTGQVAHVPLHAHVFIHFTTACIIWLCKAPRILASSICFLMRDERKKQARSNKQTRQSNTAHRRQSHVHVHERWKKEEQQQLRQSNTAHPRQSLFQRKMSCLGWDSNPRHSIHTSHRTLYHMYICVAGGPEHLFEISVCKSASMHGV